MLESLKIKLEEKRIKNKFLDKILLPKDILGKIKRNLKPETYRSHILKKHRAVYFSISKVANSSLKIAFYKLEYGKNTCHPRISERFPEIKKKNLHKYKNYFKFAFVRNPYDRLVSCYKNKIKHNKPKYTGLGFIHGVCRGFIKKYGEGYFYPGMSFKEFVKKISKIPDEKSDNHFKSQYTFLIDMRGNLIPDFIGRFENLEKDYKKICERIGVENPPRLPKKNKSKNKKHYSEYYGKETKRLVKERYKKDLELFNYRFDNNDSDSD